MVVNAYLIYKMYVFTFFNYCFDDGFVHVKGTG